MLAPPARELDAGLNVSHDCVLDADQLSVVDDAPPFITLTSWLEVAVFPCITEKFNEVDVVTERTAGDAVIKVWSEEVAVPPTFVAKDW